MARIYKDTYTAFQRNILEEFMTEEELAELDKKYNEGKLKRSIKLAKARAKKTRKTLNSMSNMLITTKGVEKKLPYYLSLTMMQKLVGGYIESIKVAEGELIVNEEGRIKNLPFNRKASAYFRLDLYGDIIIKK